MGKLAATVRRLWSTADRQRTAEGEGVGRRHPFDLQHGTETSGFIEGKDLVTGHPHDASNTAYYGMSPSRFRGAVELWKSSPPRAPVEDYTFFDLGCGKGRAVLMATEYPFREVVGVELHPGLARVAQQNLRTWAAAGKGLSPARIIVGDATELPFPDSPCLVYLFNPFGRPVLDKLLDRLETSLRRSHGLLDLLYFNPAEAAALKQRPPFELLWSGTVPMSADEEPFDRLANPDDLCHLYRWKPGSPDHVS